MKPNEYQNSGEYGSSCASMQHEGGSSVYLQRQASGANAHGSERGRTGRHELGDCAGAGAVGAV